MLKYKNILFFNYKLCLHIVHLSVIRSIIYKCKQGLFLWFFSKLCMAQSLVSYEQLPDWSGVWQMNGSTVFDASSVQPEGGRAGSAGVREFPPYNEEWEAIYEDNMEQVSLGRFPDPLSICGTPAGYPRMLNVPGAIEFVVRPEQVWILTEDGPSIARIYTDGRSHPPEDEIWPTYSGESVGYWEGDTLVFETIGIKGKGDAIIDRTGLVLSVDARIKTEIRRVDISTMEAQIEITDSTAMTESWVVTKRYGKLEDGARMFDVACVENNRNPIDETGRTLTLDSQGNILDSGVN